MLRGDGDGDVVDEFDWFGFEDALVAELRSVARALVYQVDGELPFAFALTGGYHEIGGTVDLPVPALGTVESVAPQHIRTPEQWRSRDDNWARRPPVDWWCNRLNDSLDGLDAPRWERAHGKYRHTVNCAMKRVRAELVAEGAFPSRIAVIVDGQAL